MKTQLCLLLACLSLTACGGGGGGSSSGGDNTTPAAENKTFTVGVNSLEVTRPNRGETVAVDSGGVVTEIKTYTP